MKALGNGNPRSRMARHRGVAEPPRQTARLSLRPGRRGLSESSCVRLRSASPLEGVRDRVRGRRTRATRIEDTPRRGEERAVSDPRAGAEMKLVTSAQMRELEQAAVAAGGSEAQLMEEAGLAVAQEAWMLLGTLEGRRIVVLAGPGEQRWRRARCRKTSRAVGCGGGCVRPARPARDGAR